LELKYKFDKIGFGKLSKIFNTNVNDVYFDAPILGEYDFVGLEFSFFFKDFKFISQIGGNNLNAPIIDVALKHSSRKGEYTFFYLFAGRDNNFNINMHSLGLDLYHDFSVLSLYESITYQYLPSGTRNQQRENLVSLTELIVQPVISFEFGTNYLFSRYDWNQLKTWQSQSFMNYDYKEISIYSSYLYKNWENFFNRTINQILFFNVTPQFKIGLNSSYFIPSEGDDYYQIGFQVNFHEENN